CYNVYRKYIIKEAILMKRLMVTLVLGMGSLAALAGGPRQEPIQPIEYPTDLDEAKVELGKKLFFDPRLSKSGWISCNSCHNLSMCGTDNLVSSVGHGWAEGRASCRERVWSTL